jgi:hypothetical protein
MPPAHRLSIALAAALSHWMLLAAIQVGGFCAYLMPAGSDPWDVAGYLVTIPFIQGQTIVVAATLGLVAWLFSAHSATRWLILPVHFFLTGFILADQLFSLLSG